MLVLVDEPAGGLGDEGEDDDAEDGCDALDGGWGAPGPCGVQCESTVGNASCDEAAWGPLASLCSSSLPMTILKSV